MRKTQTLFGVLNQTGVGSVLYFFEIVLGISERVLSGGYGVGCALGSGVGGVARGDEAIARYVERIVSVFNIALHATLSCRQHNAVVAGGNYRAVFGMEVEPRPYGNFVPTRVRVVGRGRYAVISRVSAVVGGFKIDAPFGEHFLRGHKQFVFGGGCAEPVFEQAGVLLYAQVVGVGCGSDGVFLREVRVGKRCFGGVERGLGECGAVACVAQNVVGESTVLDVVVGFLGGVDLYARGGDALIGGGYGYIFGRQQIVQEFAGVV